MRHPEFERVPGPPEERFGPVRPADPKKGPGDFARDDRTAEKARAKHADLVKELQAKQMTVQGDFSPSDFPDHGQVGPETIWLEGGPIDGRTARVRHGAPTHTVPVAGSGPVVSRQVVNEAGKAQTEQSGQFIPAEYIRTKKLSNEGLPIFRFRPVTV